MREELYECTLELRESGGRTIAKRPVCNFFRTRRAGREPRANESDGGRGVCAPPAAPRLSMWNATQRPRLIKPLLLSVHELVELAEQLWLALEVVSTEVPLWLGWLDTAEDPEDRTVSPGIGCVRGCLSVPRCLARSLSHWPCLSPGRVQRWNASLAISSTPSSSSPRPSSHSIS